MASKSNQNKSMKDLNDEIEMHQMFLDEFITNDNNGEFIKQMDEFRDFLKNACKLTSGYIQLYNQYYHIPTIFSFPHISTHIV